MTEQLLYDYKAASKRLGYVVSDSWLQEHKNELPHTQIGRKVGFSDEDLAELLQMFKVRPIQSAKSVERSTLPTPAAPKTLRDIKPRGANRRTA